MVEGFQHTEIGTIPNDWDDPQLGSVCIKVQDGNYGGSYPKSHEFLKIGVPFLTSKAIGKDGILKDHLIDFISKAKHDELKKAHLQLNDVLFTNRGASVGAIGFVDERVSNGNIGPQLTLLRANQDILSPKYLLQAMKSNFVQKQIVGQDAGSAMNFFGVTATKKFKIPLPPTKAEQTAIATALNDADALIQKLEQLIAKKRNIKTGAMHELLKPKEGWEVKTIEDCTDCLDNLRVPLNESQRLSMKGDYPYCGANGILDYINDYKINDEVILIAEDGGYFDEYATRPIAYKMKGKFWVNNHAHILKAKTEYEQDFIFYSLVHKNILTFLASGTRAKLNKSEMYKIEIDTPKDKVEQTRIAQILSDMDNEIQELEKQLEKYKLMKQGMMQSLLTGKIRLV